MLLWNLKWRFVILSSASIVFAHSWPQTLFIYRISKHYKKVKNVSETQSLIKAFYIPEQSFRISSELSDKKWNLRITPLFWPKSGMCKKVYFAVIVIQLSTPTGFWLVGKSLGRSGRQFLFSHRVLVGCKKLSGPSWAVKMRTRYWYVHSFWNSP